MNLDNTARTTFLNCPRKFELQNLKHIFPVTGSSALRYGSAWHSAVEGFYGVIGEKGWGFQGEGIVRGSEMAKQTWAEESEGKEFYDDFRTLPNLMKGFLEYLNHFHGDEGFLRVVEPERVFKILLYPTSLELEHFPGIEPFYFTGKIDLIVELSGRKWIMEHKTTGRPLSMHMQTLNRSAQLIGYNYAVAAYSKEKTTPPDGTLVALSHLRAYKSKVTGNYGEPKFDFARSPQVFSAMDLANWRYSFFSDAYQIQAMKKNRYFPMRHHSCFQYGQCSYMDICIQQRNSDRASLANYYVEENPWSVLKGEEDKLIIVEETEEDAQRWDELERLYL